MCHDVVHEVPPLVKGLGSEVQCLRFRVQYLRFGVQGLRFTV